MFELGNIISYLIYGPVMLWLIRRSYDQIYRFKAKRKINKLQLRLYSLILLIATFLWAVDRWFLIFQVVITFILILVFFLEGKEYGKMKTSWEIRNTPMVNLIEGTDEEKKKGRKNKGEIPSGLKYERNTCIIIGVVTFLSLANTIFALWGGLTVTLW